MNADLVYCTLCGWAIVRLRNCLWTFIPDFFPRAPDKQSMLLDIQILLPSW